VGDKTYEASILGNIGKVYLKENKFKEAENYLQQSVKINTEINSVYDLSFQYETLSELYQKINQPQKALDAYKKYVETHDTLNSEENRKASFQKEMLYEFDKKQSADSIKVAEEKKLSELKFSEEKKRNKLTLILGSGVLAIVIAFAAFVYNRLKISQKQKRTIQNQRDLVQEQKNLVEQQKLIVEEKQKEILDSIKYAKRIQQAMLPSEKFINRKLKNKE
jgi:tetratricopeptide (TPR) repeat protein